MKTIHWSKQQRDEFAAKWPCCTVPDDGWATFDDEGNLVNISTGRGEGLTEFLRHLQLTEEAREAEIALLRFTIKRMGSERDEALDALEGMARDYAALLVFVAQGKVTRGELDANDIATPQVTWKTRDGAPSIDTPILRKHGRL